MNPEEEAWKLALANRLPEAYTQLKELADAGAENLDLALRLYWLLAIQPELDSTRSRHDWLAAVLIRSRLSTPALELYERELEANPGAGLSEPYARLLEADASGSGLLWLARQRLAAAGLKRAWSTIDDDLSILSNRAALFDEVAWLSFLVEVMEQVCFDQPAPAYERCLNLLSGLRHLEPRQPRAFAKIEELQEKALVWRGATAAPAAIREVVRDSWAAHASVWKKTMPRAAAWAASDLASALAQLDQATRVRECQAVFARFQYLLDECEPPTTTYPSGLVRGLVRDFLLKNGRENYTGMRPELLRLLVREAIDPHELMRACEVDSALGPRALVEHVRTDTVMRLLWQTIHSGQG